MMGVIVGVGLVICYGRMVWLSCVIDIVISLVVCRGVLFVSKVFLWLLVSKKVGLFG